MRQKPTEFQKYSEKIRLRAAERRELRDRILSYMEYHPLPKADTQVVATKTPSRAFAVFRQRSVQIVAGAFALLIVVGVPLTAEQTLPGDVLYPVKVRFNEEVRSTLALTPFQRIEWETRRVERRIAEARVLAREGLLTEEVEDAIEEDVRAHTEAAQKELNTLRESDVDGAAVAEVTFESALDVQSAVLDTDLEKNNDVEGIAAAVRVAKETSQKDGLAASTTPPSYAGLTARVEQETTRAYEFFKTVSEFASETEQADIEQRLEDTGRIVARAAVAHENENDVEAVALLRGALSNAKKLIAFMTDIDVRETVLLDKLVPRDRTDDERLEVLAVIRQEIEKVLTGAVVAVEGVEDETVLARLKADTLALEELLHTWDEQLEDSDMDGSEKTAADAEVAADELLQFMTDEGIMAETGEKTEEDDVNEEDKITNFEECVAVTGIVMESFPRQCAAPDGTVFVEEIEDGFLEETGEATTTEETIEE